MNLLGSRVFQACSLKKTAYNKHVYAELQPQSPLNFVIKFLSLGKSNDVGYSNGPKLSLCLIASCRAVASRAMMLRYVFAHDT